MFFGSSRPSGSSVADDEVLAEPEGRATIVGLTRVDQGAARDLVWGRQDCCGDLMCARHRLSKLLLRHESSATTGTRGPASTTCGFDTRRSRGWAPQRLDWRSTPTTRAAAAPAAALAGAGVRADRRPRSR